MEPPYVPSAVGGAALTLQVLPPPTTTTTAAAATTARRPLYALFFTRPPATTMPSPRYRHWSCEPCEQDVEGSELRVLETIDFSRTRIDVLSIELSWTDKSRKCRSLLRRVGFVECGEQPTPATSVHRPRPTAAAPPAARRPPPTAHRPPPTAHLTAHRPDEGWPHLTVRISFLFVHRLSGYRCPTPAPWADKGPDASYFHRGVPNGTARVRSSEYVRDKQIGRNVANGAKRQALLRHRRKQGSERSGASAGGSLPDSAS